MTRASLIRVGQQSLQFGAFDLKPTGLIVTGSPSRADWERCGDVLQRMEGAVQWWIGDWLNYGERRWGKYDQALESTGRDYQTLADYAYVASHVEFSLRNENLGYHVHRAVAPLKPEQQRRILDRAESERLTVSAVREVVRAELHADKVAAIAAGVLPAGEYDVVCGDPPWAYDNSGFHQAAAAHYPTLTTDAICQLPQTDATFPQFADPCVLFLWATSPLLPAAIDVIAAWGFTYKAHLVWVKNRTPGMGWWLDTRHELLLIGARGSAATPLARVDSVFEAVAGAHSRKPDQAYAAIEQMFPGPVRRVELFARAPRHGWAVWGNEV